MSLMSAGKKPAGSLRECGRETLHKLECTQIEVTRQLIWKNWIAT